MQYSFCYKGIYKGIINTDRFVCKDNNNQYFYWVDIEQLNSYNVVQSTQNNIVNSVTYINNLKLKLDNL